MKLVDAHARTVEYLRLSLTERCNFACTYCVPHDLEELPSAWMSDDEIVALVAALAAIGLRRVRLTGGEPTLRPRLPALVARLAALGLTDLALTTNGARLAELAGSLRDAGLHRLNISLDTLDAAAFGALTGGALNDVLSGIEASRVAGFVHTKLNIVALRGVNDAELPALAAFAWARGMTPRFIELMPMSSGIVAPRARLLPAAEIRSLLERAFGPLVAEEGRALPGVGPARYHVTRQGKRVGIIAAVTERFCASCNRVRVSARGHLHTCLGIDDGPQAIDLREALRGGPERVHDAMRRALSGKGEGHSFSLDENALSGGPRRHMLVIGG